jgi:hypothetical protein
MIMLGPMAMIFLRMSRHARAPVLQRDAQVLDGGHPSIMVNGVGASAPHK